jgi:predicted cupin superfamily sugar epimerase
MDPHALAEELRLAPLPVEGGLFRSTYVDEYSSAIYYLLIRPDVSAMHRLPSTEIFHYYAGSAAQMLLLHADGIISEPRIGTDLARGESPQVIVPAGVWQGTETLGDWTLLGTTQAPPYTDAGFEPGRRAGLIRDWPRAAERIRRLTPSPSSRYRGRE